MSSTILVVDDDAGCGRLLTALIRRLGHEAEYMPNGTRALAWLSEHPADLVLLDVMMPDMDGIEVLQRLRQDPHTSDVPVVIFSALADPQVRQQAREQGAADYWLKASLNFHDLERRLEAYLPHEPHA